MSPSYQFYRSIFPSRRQEEVCMDEESSKSLLQLPYAFTEDQRSIGTFRIHAAFCLLHTVIAGLWISTFWTLNLNAPSRVCTNNGEGLRKYEFSPIAEALSYETVTFKISGGGTRDDPVTPYEGPPTPEKDMKWYELMNVGMISLTPSMNATLPFPTQPIAETDPTPLIQLDVFHQLHCLNSIRQIVYGTNKWYNPSDRQDQIHIDHCIDYLRQVLMCHSDVTPITHAARPKPYNPILQPWRPNFAVTHTCRDFWGLHEWAAGRNASGFVIETWPGTDPVAELREKVVGGEGGS